MLAVENDPLSASQILAVIYDGRYSRTRERRKIRLALYQMSQTGLLDTSGADRLTFTTSPAGKTALRAAGL